MFTTWYLYFYCIFRIMWLWLANCNPNSLSERPQWTTMIHDTNSPLSVCNVCNISPHTKYGEYRTLILCWLSGGFIFFVFVLFYFHMYSIGLLIYTLVLNHYTPRFNEVERGHTGFTLSVCGQNCVRSVSSDPFHIWIIHFIFAHLIKQLQKVFPV